MAVGLSMMDGVIVFILGFIGVSILIWAFSEAKYEEERRKREFQLHKVQMEIENERLKHYQRLNEKIIESQEEIEEWEEVREQLKGAIVSR